MNNDITLRDMIFEMLDNLNWYELCECGHVWSIGKQFAGQIWCPKQTIFTSTGSYVTMQPGHKSIKTITAREYYVFRQNNG